MAVYGGNPVAYLADQDTLDEREANAHLIAAAPDMYKALKAVLSTVIVNDDMTITYAIDFTVTQQINRALKKAEGR
jgi:hypothetical protein